MSFRQALKWLSPRTGSMPNILRKGSTASLPILRQKALLPYQYYRQHFNRLTRTGQLWSSNELKSVAQLPACHKAAWCHCISKNPKHLNRFTEESTWVRYHPVPHNVTRYVISETVQLGANELTLYFVVECLFLSRREITVRWTTGDVSPTKGPISMLPQTELRKIELYQQVTKGILLGFIGLRRNKLISHCFQTLLPFCECHNWILTSETVRQILMLATIL